MTMAKPRLKKNFQDSWNFEGDFLSECDPESGLRFLKNGTAVEAYEILVFRP
jgi:hypothetical protein